MKIYFSLVIILLSSFLKIAAQCTAVNSISENFDGWKGMSSCWDTKSGLSMVYHKNSRITFYSLMTPNEDMYLITPRLKAGTYTMSFDVSKSGGSGSIHLVAIEDKSDKSSFINLSKSSEISGGKITYHFKIYKNVNIGLKILLTEMHQAVYVDNVKIIKK